MKVNYNEITISSHEKANIIKTIYHNPYIPVKPYAKQIYVLADENKRALAGGSAGSGKSILGAMLACQYFDVQDYRCLIIRRTWDDVIATGGIVDYLTQWFEPFLVKNGGHIQHNESKRVFINKRNNAKIYYNYAMYEEDRLKFKSRSYHLIIIDEASELLQIVLRYFNRSLRYPTSTGPSNRLPLRLRYLTNPADSDGIEYLKKKFVKPKGKFPYYEMHFWDNPHADKDYDETLSELSKPDYEFQMGNWDYELKAGDIFDRELFKECTLKYDEYLDYLEKYEILNIIRGWDYAATENDYSDYTVGSKLTQFTNQIKIVTNQKSFQANPGKLEAKMHIIMDEDTLEVEQWGEEQPAMAGKVMKNYYKNEFKEHNYSEIPPFKNKIVRASEIVKEMKKGRLWFVDDPEEPYLKDFIKQAIKFPSKKKVKDDESTHMDRVDSVSLIIQGIKMPKTVLKKRKRWKRQK